ncbi:MAG: nucleotidyl transferase AbiEii/AbiGii toxin family protein [Myxococcota bacterium]
MSAIAGALAGQDWYLVGAQAALLRGSRRLTSDVDVTVLPRGTPTEELVRRLAAHGLSLRVPDSADFVRQTRVLPAVHDMSGMPVDVVLGGPGLEEVFLQAAEEVSLGDLRIPVATAEHLIVMKLLAARPKDMQDAVAIASVAEADLTEVEALVEAIAAGLGEDDIRIALAELRRQLAIR